MVREESLPPALLEVLLDLLPDGSLCGSGESDKSDESDESGRGARVLTLDGDEAASLLAAGREYLAERAAMGYLARAEHSRRSLELKLARKGYAKAEIGPALDRLAASGCLDDARFAGAWLRNRAIHQCEGRRRLEAELRERGVCGTDAAEAMAEFFSANDEVSLCRRAAEKLGRLGKTGDSLEKALARKGFSCKIIREALFRNAEGDEPFQDS